MMTHITLNLSNNVVVYSKKCKTIKVETKRRIISLFKGGTRLKVIVSRPSTSVVAQKCLGSPRNVSISISEIAPSCIWNLCSV